MAPACVSPAFLPRIAATSTRLDATTHPSGAEQVLTKSKQSRHRCCEQPGLDHHRFLTAENNPVGDCSQPRVRNRRLVWSVQPDANAVRLVHGWTVVSSLAGATSLSEEAALASSRDPGLSVTLRRRRAWGGIARGQGRGSAVTSAHVRSTPPAGDSVSKAIPCDAQVAQWIPCPSTRETPGMLTRRQRSGARLSPGYC
jgi:hypothetical protein